MSSRSDEYRIGYQAGYQAKSRLAARTEAANRFDLFYSAAMTGLLSNAPWVRGDVRDSTPAAYASTAAAIAKAMIEERP